MAAPTNTQQRWTTRSLMQWMLDTFAQREIDEPRLTAELLLEHAAGLSRMDLYTQADRPATADELDTLRSMVKRVLAGEPVQYAIGCWYFFGLRLRVDRRVLIPRPCTELICEEVVQDVRRRRRDAAASDDPPPAEPFERVEHADDGANASDSTAPADASVSADATSRPPEAPLGEGVLIADVGTGSGAIALALAVNLPGAELIATDCSADAIDLAAANAAELGLADRIRFLQGDGPRPLLDDGAVRARSGLDYLCSNPPYIPDSEWNNPDMMDRHVREHEPELALRGGPDGMLVIAPLVRAAPELLKPGGLLLLETAASTADAVAALVERTPGLACRGVRNDLDGLPRLVIGQRTTDPTTASHGRTA